MLPNPQSSRSSSVVMTNPPFAGDIPEKWLINLYSDVLGMKYTFRIDMGKMRLLIRNRCYRNEFGSRLKNDVPGAELPDKAFQLRFHYIIPGLGKCSLHIPGK